MPFMCFMVPGQAPFSPGNPVPDALLLPERDRDVPLWSPRDDRVYLPVRVVASDPAHDAHRRPENQRPEPGPGEAVRAARAPEAAIGIVEAAEHHHVAGDSDAEAAVLLPPSGRPLGPGGSDLRLPA